MTQDLEQLAREIAAYNAGVERARQAYDRNPAAAAREHSWWHAPTGPETRR